LKYRAEIDGLRALAVVPVILFHAGFELFSGGFVGVDVFFVISGYLITTILIEDMENNRFSLLNFYERRARRILPALFFVMLVCIPFAWMWMLPNQMKDFSQSLVAVSLFASNILFWRESGYFDAAAEEKPLLHTWSLAVEEQYYIFFPIFLILAWRFGKNRVFWMIVVMASASLLLSEWGWRNKPTANFYLAPTRAWELFAGSIAAFIVQKNGVQKNNFLALLGLAGIVFSIFFYDESTPFPSVYALVPVIGVVLLVLYAERETLAAKLLSTKAFVGIGLISYSAYLWHQPLFAFSRIKLLQEPSSMLMSVLALCSLLLAYFSWKFIETPFRKRGAVTRNKVFIFSALGLVLFSCLGLMGHQTIFKSYSEIVMDTLLEDIDKDEYGGLGFGWVDLINQPEVLIVGDSHAKQYIKAARELNPNSSLIAESACISLPNLINHYQNLNVTRKNCINLHNEYLQYLKENPSIKTLVFSHRWGKLLFDLKETKILGSADKSPEILDRLKRDLSDYFVTLNELNVEVIVIGNVPSAYVASNNMKEGYVKCIYKYGKSLCPKTYNVVLREGQWINDLLSELARKYENISFLDPMDRLCDGDECFIVKDKKLLYSDHAHLTTFGARAVLEGLLN
jgi:peptidoglycan/LPS O-acetylase OafA/YrhL